MQYKYMFQLVPAEPEQLIMMTIINEFCFIAILRSYSIFH